MKTALEEQYGGEEEVVFPNAVLFQPVLSFLSLYMLTVDIFLLVTTDKSRFQQSTI
jgi:hypothetical protein